MIKPASLLMDPMETASSTLILTTILESILVTQQSDGLPQHPLEEDSLLMLTLWVSNGTQTEALLHSLAQLPSEPIQLPLIQATSKLAGHSPSDKEPVEIQLVPIFSSIHLEELYNTLKSVLFTLFSMSSSNLHRTQQPSSLTSTTLVQENPFLGCHILQAMFLRG
jgi:hypothetical protein